MPLCETCGKEWTEKALLEDEGLGHFFASDQERTIVEPDGSRWVVVFAKRRSVRRLKHCKKCAITVGTSPGEA